MVGAEGRLDELLFCIGHVCEHVVHELFLLLFEVGLVLKLLSQEVAALAPRALHHLEFELIILTRLLTLFLLLIFLFVLGFIILLQILRRVIDLLVIHTVVKLPVVVEFVLTVYLSTQSTESQNEILIHHHWFYALLEHLNIFTLCRVEGSQDDRLL